MDRYIKIFKNWKTEKANFKIQKKIFKKLRVHPPIKLKSKQFIRLSLNLKHMKILSSRYINLATVNVELAKLQ